MTRISINRKDLVRIYSVFTNYNKSVDPLFSFFISRNLKYINDEIETIREFESNTLPTSEFFEFEKKRDELYYEYALKNDDGSITTDNNGQPLFDQESAKIFKEKFDEIRNVYKDVLDVREKNFQTYNDLMNESVDLEILQISYHKLPKDIEFEHSFNIIFMEYFCKETPEELEELLLN